MNFKLLVTVTAIVCVFFSCKKNANRLERLNTPFTVPDAAMKGIFSEWYFISSRGGFAGTGSDKFKTGDHIEFNASGIYSENIDNTLSTQEFRFRKLESSMSGTGFIIDYKGNFAQSFRISHDTLYLMDEVYDGFNFVFKK